MGYKRLLLILIFLALGCQFVQVVPQTSLPTEITPPPGEGSAVTEGTPPAEGQETPAPPTETPTPGPTLTPTPIPTPTATRFFLELFSMGPPRDPYVPRNGLVIAVVIPFLVFGLPWLAFEFFAVRYVQPIGLDISRVKIKAQDGLFVEADISITARRTLTVASTRMTWARVRVFVEKGIEQELIHEALQFTALDDLERGLKGITEDFMKLPLVRELLTDFGVELIRFNIETRYPEETRDALNRKAEASAGGQAYLAYAAAAHLDPDTFESRELYRVYQQTTSQVDAARNLGGGLAYIADSIARGRKLEEEIDESDD